MTLPAPKRFWTVAHAVPVENGYAVHLDSRPILTPGKRTMRVPSLALAEVLAGEWNAVQDAIDPRAMPFNRSVNSAIDQVAPNRAEVVAELAGYGDSDLLCYRADGPDALVLRQTRAWDPVLGWARRELEADLVAMVGVMHHPQPEAALAALTTAIEDHGVFELTALHELVTLSGSLVLGLAVSSGHLDGETAWDASRIDEDWQTEQWGSDPEAEAVLEARKTAFLHAERTLSLVRSRPV